MTSDLMMRRRFFAEEVQAVCHLRTVALVEALVRVPRERFLRPGPWMIRSEGDFGAPPRPTPDADPRHVYHNVSIAIDPARQIFNGAPGVVCLCIDALGLKAGERMLHVGCGLGYYSALAADCVGPTGRVVAVEVDAGLAAEARANLAAFDSVEARQGDGTDTRGETFDAILVNAGMTHPHEAWLQALRPGGRLLLPLTCTMEAMGSTLGKGVILLISDTGDREALDVRVVTMVAIYSAVGIRDESMNGLLGKAFMGGPWPRIRKLRRDPHAPSPSCWLHADTYCLAAG